MPRAVILTALLTEYMAVRAHLRDIEEETHSQGTIYEQGVFIANDQTWDVGVVEIGAGNPGAAAEAERAIAHFSPDIILFVGVAGGIKDVKLGDVVASTKVYGYESGKAEQTFRPRYEIGLSAHNLEQRARAEARKSDWLQRVSYPIPNPTPRVFVAPIAAGEKVVASTESEVFQFLRSNCGDAVAIEMEGFGFLKAAHVNQRVSAIIIRGISDLIDNKSEVDKAGYQEIAARHASAFAFEILAKLENCGIADNMIQKTLPKQETSPKVKRTLIVQALKYLIEELSVSKKTAYMVFDAAIDNLNELDGIGSTDMAEALSAVRQSRFGKLCHRRFLQSYIQAHDDSRLMIGVTLMMFSLKKIESLNVENAAWILRPHLEILRSSSDIEERVDVALNLVDLFYQVQRKNANARIDFLPDELFSETVNTLLMTNTEDIADNDPVLVAAMWGLVWLTNAKICDHEVIYSFTKIHQGYLQKIIKDGRQDAYARSWAALILSLCGNEKPVFAQADWIYEWAVVADGNKPQRQLPVAMPLNRPEDIKVLKHLISLDLPIKSKSSVAIALGRLGCFIPEMVDPLLNLFKDDLCGYKQRDEALVYLVLTGGDKVNSALIEGANRANDNAEQYGLADRCFLAIIGMGDVNTLKYQLHLGIGEDYINSYAYALAGLKDLQGREILQNMEYHPKTEVRKAAATALIKIPDHIREPDNNPKNIAWNELTQWVNQVLQYILDGINKAIEVTSDAFVYLMKKGNCYYNRLEVYVRNVLTNKTRVISQEQEVNKDDIPDEIRQQLDQHGGDKKLKLMQLPI